MPSPVCLISRPPYASSPRRTSASCTRTSSSAALSPRRAVISVEPTMSVNMTARSPESTAGRDRVRGRARIADTAEERLDGGKIDRNDGVGDLHHALHDGPARRSRDPAHGRGRRRAPLFSSNQ